MSVLGTIQGITIANGGVFCMGRIYGNAGTLITQASISSIAYYVYTVTNLGVETSVGSGSLTVSTSIYDTLQTTDPRWTKDTTGYNFAATIPASLWTGGGLKNRISVKFTPVSGEVFVQTFESIPIKSNVS